MDFSTKPILGMIHLAGDDPVKRALDEVAIYEEEGIDGVIVENYHGTASDVVDVLRVLDTSILVGVNILPNNFWISLPLAVKYKLDFVQLDHVAGVYESGSIDYNHYKFVKERNKVLVLGGVWPKYYTPVSGSDLESDLLTGVEQAEAIVVTGAGTGQETPISKVKKFRSVIGDHPLIVGAGLTVENCYSSLKLADGGIVGSVFKENGDTHKKIDRCRVTEFVDIVKEVRNSI